MIHIFKLFENKCLKLFMSVCIKEMEKNIHTYLEMFYAHIINFYSHKWMLSYANLLSNHIRTCVRLYDYCVWFTWQHEIVKLWWLYSSKLCPTNYSITNEIIICSWNNCSCGVCLLWVICWWCMVMCWLFMNWYRWLQN